MYLRVCVFVCVFARLHICVFAFVCVCVALTLNCSYSRVAKDEEELLNAERPFRRYVSMMSCQASSFQEQCLLSIAKLFSLYSFLHSLQWSSTLSTAHRDPTFSFSAGWHDFLGPLRVKQGLVIHSWKQTSSHGTKGKQLLFRKPARRGFSRGLRSSEALL